MININGKNIFGKSTTIVNGRIIGGGELGKTKKFDETRLEKARGIKKILINSDISDVDFSVSDSLEEIKIHFYGQVVIDGELSFNVRKDGSELQIKSKNSGSSFNGNLKLDITVPRKMFFEKISIKTISGDICLNKEILANSIKMVSTAGKLENYAKFTSYNARTMSGNIDITVDAENDISIVASSISGSISVDLNNIGDVMLSPSSMSGRVRNSHRKQEGYIADIDASTMSGNVIIS